MDIRHSLVTTGPCMLNQTMDIRHSLVTAGPCMLNQTTDIRPSLGIFFLIFQRQQDLTFHSNRPVWLIMSSFLFDEK